MRKTKREIIAILSHIKRHGFDVTNGIGGRLQSTSYYLEPLTYGDLDRPESIHRLSTWRKNAEAWFPTQFTITDEGTRKWLREQVLEKDDRILFYIYPDGADVPVGHIGLNRFDFRKRISELDNVVRGEKHPDTNGIMTHALQDLMQWGKIHLGLRAYNLQVLADNMKARALYARLGFSELSRKPVEEDPSRTYVLMTTGT